MSRLPGWLAIVTLLALACAMLLTAVTVRAEPRSLRDSIVAIVPSIGSRREPTVDAGELADAVLSVPKLTRDWAALLLTIAAHESALSARIAANQCKPHECDSGRASGLFQSHRNKLNEQAWGSSDVGVQTLEAARALRSAFYVCNGGGRQLGPDWVARTINAYAGRRCDAIWPGLESRLATFKRVRAKL